MNRDFRFYLWGTNIVGCRIWHLEAPMKVIARMKQLQKSETGGVMLALGGDNWSLDYGDMALHLFTAPFQSAVKRHFPSVIWAASIGPFTAKPPVERKMAKLLPKVDLITSRESLTTEYLRRLGAVENVRETTDPAFLLPVNRPKNVPDRLLKFLEDGAVGINLAPLFARYISVSQKEWFDRVSEALTYFVEHCDYKVVFIPHVMMEPEVFPDNNDYLFMQKLYQELPPKIQERFYLYDPRNDDCTNIKWVISQTKALAGCRTHATVAALSTGVPVFCIGYSVKSRGINRDIFGHEHWVEHFSKLGGKEFCHRFTELLDHSSEIRTQLADVLPAYREKAWKNGEFLLEMLKRKGFCE